MSQGDIRKIKNYANYSDHVVVSFMLQLYVNQLSTLQFNLFFRLLRNVLCSVIYSVTDSN
jgi:hypothetical protein